jgi:ankyrin repeat protein
MAMRISKVFIMLLLITSPLFAMDWWGDNLKEQRRKAQQEREQKEEDDLYRKAFATERLKEYARKLTVPYHIQYPPAFTESFVKILQNGADPNARIMTSNQPILNQPILIVALLSLPVYPQIIKALLDAGANPNTKSIVGTPALSIAATKGQVDIVKLLLEKQALVDLPDKFGETALISAIKSNNDLNTQTNLIKLLTDNGANIDYTTQNNFTPLTSAIIGPIIQPDNRIPLVSLLLEMGADPNRGVSPLTLALSDKNSDRGIKLVQLLLQAGADPNLPYNGLSPLEYARSKRNASDIQDFDQWSQIIEWLQKPETAPRLVPKVIMIPSPAKQKESEEYLINQEFERIKATEEYKKAAKEAAEKYINQLKKEKQ